MFRELVYSAQASRDRDSIEPDTRRFDEMARMVEWEVSNRPEWSPIVGGEDVRLLRFRDGDRVVCFWYRFDDRHVIIERLTVREVPRAESADPSWEF